ncbi:MAG: lipocalin family protein, partial [Planctomycetia bacterium]|nr:lipocalin family protein [Planctomycetia bacterium]
AVPVVEEPGVEEPVGEEEQPVALSDEELQKRILGTWTNVETNKAMPSMKTYSTTTYKEDGTVFSSVEVPSMNMKVDVRGTYSIKDGILTLIPEGQESVLVAIEFTSDDVMIQAMILSEKMAKELAGVQEQLGELPDEIEMPGNIRGANLKEIATSPKTWNRQK